MNFENSLVHSLIELLNLCNTVRMQYGSGHKFMRGKRKMKNKKMNLSSI
jgi:hypothetical protein